MNDLQYLAKVLGISVEDVGRLTRADLEALRDNAIGQLNTLSADAEWAEAFLTVLFNPDGDES